MRYSNRSICSLCLAALLMVLCGAGAAFAQYDTGTIAGTVLDAHGAVVAGAAVKITNTGTGRVYHVTTNSEGDYVVPSVPEGTYRVEATRDGFATSIVENVVVHASESVRADLALKVGAMVEQITVTAEATTINTLSSDLGNTIEGRRVNQLPLNGRDFTDLMALVPGSVTTGQFGQTSLGGNETSFAGVNILLDGADATRGDTNATSLQLGRETARITRASVDSVAEFRVISGVYSAEYGRSVGDVVNVITKSGTNDLHGGVFEFFRNDALDARNFFAVPGEPTPLRLNQFGGNLGGPIAKNKLFFFINYEGARQIVTNAQQFHVLNAVERAKFVAATRPIVNAIPPGNGGPFLINGMPTVFDIFNGALRNTLREDTGSEKVDWTATSKDTLSARYNINDSFTSSQYGPAIGQTAPVPGRSQFLKLSWNRTVSSTMLNELGFALNRNAVTDLGGGGAFPITAITCFLLDCGVLPGPGLFASMNTGTSYQVLDTFSLVHGRHSMRFGADIRHNLTDRGLGTQQFLSYGSLSDMETGNSAFALGTLGFPLTKFRNTNWNFFAQDDIRLKPNFTVNIGLRYEYNTVLHDADNKTSNFDFATQALLPVGQSFYNSDRNNFAPRVGFSWDPFKKGKTAIRGGFGIFYNPQLTGAVLSLPGNNNQNLSINIFDFFFIPGFSCGGYLLTFPVPNPTPVCTPASPANVNGIDRNLRDSYSEHWSFGVQQELFRNTVLEVSYVGNHGLKLPAGAAFAGLQLNSVNPVTMMRFLNQNFGDERFLGDFLTSKYNAMQVALRRHAGRLTLDANYTWSHEFDNAVSVFGAFQNARNIRGDYSEGDIDVRNNFTGSVVYEAPRWNALPKLLGDGWELASIFQARGGLPVNIVENPATFGFDPLRPNPVAGVSTRPSNYSTPNNQLNKNAFVAPPPNTFGTLRRNAARGPRFAQWDFSVIKNTALTERLKLQFRSEFFNILNHPNFANPDGTLANATFGKSTQTIGNLVGIGTSRQVQFAVKLLF
jgi:hypothetical protein